MKDDIRRLGFFASLWDMFKSSLDIFSLPHLLYHGMTRMDMNAIGFGGMVCFICLVFFDAMLLLGVICLFCKLFAILLPLL